MRRRTRAHPDNDLPRGLGGPRSVLDSAGRRASGTFRLCFDEEGAVVLTRAVIATEVPAYNEKILREIRGWRFRPYVFEGEPSGVCSEVSVSYPPTERGHGGRPGTAP